MELHRLPKGSAPGSEALASNYWMRREPTCQICKYVLYLYLLMPEASVESNDYV